MTDPTTTRVVELLRMISGGTLSQRRAAQAELRMMRANGLTVVSKRREGHTQDEIDAFQRRFDEVIAKACNITLS